MSTDEITLTIPRDEAFQQVAQLVLGGVAARVNLSYESLDDLATGLESLLERAGVDGDLTVAVQIRDGALVTEVGPFHGARMIDEIRATPDDNIGLRRILDTVVDEVELAERDGAAWIQLTKRIDTANGGR